MSSFSTRRRRGSPRPMRSILVGLAPRFNEVFYVELLKDMVGLDLSHRHPSPECLVIGRYTRNVYWRRGIPPLLGILDCLVHLSYAKGA